MSWRTSTIIGPVSVYHHVSYVETYSRSSGWVRIRHYGLLGNRCRAHTLPAARTALSQPPPVPPAPVSAPELMRRLTGIDIERCPHCHQGRLVVITTLYPLWPVEDVPRATGPPS